VISEGLLWVDAKLREDVMLSLDPGDGLVNVSKDRPLQQVLRVAFSDEAAEHLSVEGLRDSFAFGFRIGDAFQSGQELIARVDHLDGNTQFAEEPDNLLGFALTHESVFDEHGPQLPAQGAMAQHGNGRGIDASREGVDRRPIANGLFDLGDLLRNKLLRVELLGGNLSNHAATSFSYDSFHG